MSRVEERSLRALEFEPVLSGIAAYAVFAPGRERILVSRPLPGLAEARRAQRQTQQALALWGRYGRIPLEGVRDIREAVGRAVRGGLLSPRELLDIVETIKAGRRVAAFLTRGSGLAPDLAPLAHHLPHLPDLVDEIEARLDPEGSVRDTASPELARIRAARAQVAGRIQEWLEAFLRSPRARILQEPVVTLRQGRHVLPVQREHRAALPGIVHGESASGATLFVEPAAIVEWENEAARLEAEEEREVRRILQELSHQVGDRAAPLLAGVATLAELDAIRARALWADCHRAVCPALNEEGRLVIRQGRHPLLTRPAVPVDVELGTGFTTLLITGPNTGGKTVTLKMVGLFALMAQAGLPVPAAEGTDLPMLDGVYADIGDEQSLQQNLSTFSSHMSQVVGILERAGPRSLVLLDELGAGTDPAEGAALGMAILEELHARGARTVATTHLGELVLFAHLRPGMENASVEFDPETLAPTFRLLIGVPGRSNALEIARRLGLPSDLVERARGFLNREGLHPRDILAELAAGREAAGRERAALAEERARAAAARAEYEGLLARLREEQEQLRRAAAREAEALVREARREMDRLVGELRAAGAREAGDTFDQEARRIRQEADRRAEALSALAGNGSPAAGGAPGTQQLTPGVPVWVESLGRVGTLLSRSDGSGEVTVQVGPLRVQVRASEVRPAALHGQTGRQESAPPAGTPSYSALALEARTHTPPELSVRGLAVDEALARVDKYLDDAFLAGLERVTIVHGKGTGTLRRAIHALLAGHPHVRSFRLGGPGEGGHGVTRVDLGSV